MKRVFSSAFVWKCTDMCKHHHFRVQLLQNPPLCSSTLHDQVASTVAVDSGEAYVISDVGVALVILGCF